VNKVFPQYRDKTLDDFEATTPILKTAIEVVSDYTGKIALMRATGRGLTFVGQNGVGKTHLACVVMAAAMDARHKIECIELSTYIDLWQELWGVQKSDYDEDLERAHYLREQLRYIKRVHFLLLDDLGREHESVSGWSNERVFDLLRYRYNRCLPTLITTNIPIENPQAKMDLKRRYSEGMSSFLQEATIIIEMEGEDYRWKGADSSWKKDS
jgi:DNA replication protein DnaC